jgi:hypothetical protein
MHSGFMSLCIGSSLVPLGGWINAVTKLGGCELALLGFRKHSRLVSRQFAITEF